jgi:hypothetical protein
LNKIGGYKIYAELDLKAAFWQIPIDEKSSKRCAIVGPGLLLLPTRLPMGAKDSSAQLERIFRENVMYPLMNHESLKNINFAIEIYRDNLYISVNDEDVLISFINVLAEVCRGINLRLALGKLAYQKLKFWVSRLMKRN